MYELNADINYNYIYSSRASNPSSIIVIEPKSTRNNCLQWIKESKTAIEQMLLQHGGVLFRGWNINSMSDFNDIANAICPRLLEYQYRSTPRTKIGGNIYTATEYPHELSIPFHNENSYSRSWPSKILFYSSLVASTGGETPLADSRIVYNRIEKTIREKFEKKGILYVRNYNLGIDLSWQEVFQTNSIEEVNKYCKENDIEYQWKDDGPILTTRQVCQASIEHPITKERVWFNQAHLFHFSSLKYEDRILLTSTIGVERLPRNTFYGDGENIEEEVLDHIRDIYDQEMIIFKWNKSDVLILDNVLMAHSRKPFEGKRKVGVAMG